MYAPSPDAQRFGRIRLMGRMLFALAAGVGFAILAWEPPPQKNPNVGNAAVTDDHQTAAQQRDVKDDDALLPPMNAESGIGQSPDWRRAWTHPSDGTPPALVGEVDVSAMPETGDIPLARHAVEDGSDDSVVPHSE